MKKTGIITFHFVNNVGGILQCVGLQKQLEKTGTEARIIDYCPRYHASKYSSWHPVFYRMFRDQQLLRRKGAGGMARLIRGIKMIIGGMQANLHYFRNRKRRKVFVRFVRDNLLRSRKYRSLQQLRKDPPPYDAYISGSDQVWNTSLTNGVFDSAYFLRFGKPETRRIAYAVSAGETDLLSVAEAYKEETKDLDAILFRESRDSKKSLQILGKGGLTAPDPTLFLTKEEWGAYEAPVDVPEPYCFVYTVMKSEKVRRLVSEITDDRGMYVIDGSTHGYMQANGHYRHDPFCGPGEFLSYIRNAGFVITNSFHGTMFSLIYHKNFVTVANDKRNERIREILRIAGLEDRLVTECDAEALCAMPAIDYAEVERKLSRERERASGLLKSALDPDKWSRMEQAEQAVSDGGVEEGKTGSMSVRAFAGRMTDPEQIRVSSSGGAAYALAKAVICRGGAVFGVVYSEDFRSALYACAETEQELESFRTSKYISAEKKMVYKREEISVYEAVARVLAGGQEVLFTGLGCETGALIRYLENHSIRREKLYLVDLICHGPTYPEVQRQYVERLEKHFGSGMTAFSTRYKKVGWKPFYIRAEFENGRVYEERFYDSDFGHAFRRLAKESCYHCRFKGDGHPADLTIGDYWGCSVSAECYHPLGVSVLFCRTPKGEQMIRMLEESGSFMICETDAETALEKNPSYFLPREKDVRGDRFKDEMVDGGLHRAVLKDQGILRYHLTRIRHKVRDSMAGGGKITGK